MSLLESIQQSVVDGNTDLSTVLRQCRLLAARLGSRPLEDWVLWESSGYPPTANVPSYRVWPLDVRGHFSGPFGSMVKNYLIPPAALPEKVRSEFERWEYRQSVASLEAAVAETKGALQVASGDLALVLGTNVLDRYNCIEAWGEFSALRLVEVLNSVRNSVLEFAVAVWKEAPAAGETNGSPASELGNGRVTQIFFNTVVRGGSVSLVGAVNASTVTFNVMPGDWASLEHVLAEHGLVEADLRELQAALEADPEPQDAHSFGPKVATWIAAVMKKAAAGAWGIGLEAAGSLLAQSIAKYYGL